MTGSGRYFDPLNPTPESVHMPDVARGLKNIRFNGHLRELADFPDPRSIASHSMRVARLAWWRMTDGGFCGHDEAWVVLAALIHDAPEGYCQDRVRPLKTDADREVEARVLVSIARHLVEDAADDLVAEVGCDVVRWADDVALAQEAMLFQCGAEDWADACRMIVAETLHLFWPREGECWAQAVDIVTHMVTSPAPVTWERLGRRIGIGQP